MKRVNLRFFLIITLILLIFVRCDEDETPFPYISVYTTLYLDTDLGNMLVGQYKEIDGYGLGGLIIYRKDYNEFQAFDRACTHEASYDCILFEDPDYTGIYKCPCCESEFWMLGSDFSGTVKQGPANQPLKQYRCIFDGINTIRVTN